MCSVWCPRSWSPACCCISKLVCPDMAEWNNSEKDLKEICLLDSDKLRCCHLWQNDGPWSSISLKAVVFRSLWSGVLLPVRCGTVTQRGDILVNRTSDFLLSFYAPAPCCSAHTTCLCLPLQPWAGVGKCALKPTAYLHHGHSLSLINNDMLKMQKCSGDGSLIVKI